MQRQRACAAAAGAVLEPPTKVDTLRRWPVGRTAADGRPAAAGLASSSWTCPGPGVLPRGGGPHASGGTASPWACTGPCVLHRACGLEGIGRSCGLPAGVGQWQRACSSPCTRPGGLCYPLYLAREVRVLALRPRLWVLLPNFAAGVWLIGGIRSPAELVLIAGLCRQFGTLSLTLARS